MPAQFLALAMGLGTGLGLIVAIGAQNAFVLRLGITGPRRAVVAVVLVCTLSDVVLIVVGVLGIAVLVERAPWLLDVLRFAGAVFLVAYGLLAARRAARPRALVVDGPTPAAAAGDDRGAVDTALRVATKPRSRTAVLTALAFTWLNPHVYIDTVLFVGSIADQQGPSLRWWWAAGAIVASCLWFAALGFSARWLRPVFERPRAWRVLDCLIAVVMIGLGVRLALFG